MTNANARPIRFFACDIDGCLAAAGHQAFEHEYISRMADLNRLSRDDPSVPALTLVTGRPHAYVDAVMQLLDVHLPVSFENGAGFATRHPYAYWLAPEVEARLGEMKAFAADLADDDRLLLQPGKIASLSVFPRRGEELGLDDVEEILRTKLALAEVPLVLDPSTDCVNVLLIGCDKATGFAHLCRALGAEPGEVAGIGDSVGDRDWLSMCGVSVAPSNAAPEVRQIATRVFGAPDVRTAAAAYEWLVERNRAE